MKQEDIDIRQEKCLDDAVKIMEEGASLTQEQMDALQDDPETMAACEDIVIIADGLRRVTSSTDEDDIERRLHRFHQNHRNRQRRLRAMGLTAIGMAAAFAGILSLLHSTHRQEKELFFKAEEGNITAQLTNKAGQPVTLHLYTDDQSEEPHLDVAAMKREVQPADTMTLRMPNGNSCHVMLPDGSQVFLHPGSRLVYPQAFLGKNREVRLEGQGYFIVAKDKEHPFVILTEKSMTTVTGTEFNVTAIKGQADKVTLVNGSVLFRDRHSQKEVAIIPGQQASTTPYGYVSVCEADTMAFTAWRDGYLYYDKSTLAEILRQIGRSYNVSIECHSPALLAYRMHFAIRRDRDLEYVVRMLNRMKKVNAEVKDGKIVIE